MLVYIIESAMFDSRELAIDRMTFGKKVKFCKATDLIHADVSHVLLKYAKIRNKFAHQMWPTLTEKEQRDFINVFRQSARLKKRLSKEIDLELNISYCALPILMYLLEQIYRVEEERVLLNNF